MDTEDLGTLFEQAEHERTVGSNQLAIALYHQVAAQDGPLQIPALHMQGVALNNSGESGKALELYEQLLSRDLDALTKGNVLRDAGGALIKLKRFDEATAKLDESAKVLAGTGDRAAQGATIYFQARNLAKQGKPTEALALAQKAKLELDSTDNDQIKLYLNLFMAQLHAECGQAEEARSLASQTMAAAREFGKPEHVQRAELIIELADRPKELADRIEDQAKD